MKLRDQFTNVPIKTKTMKIIQIALATILLSGGLNAQSYPRIPLIGEKAPGFTAKSTKGFIHFPEDFGKNWKLILSHPKNFTPVCTSELLVLADMQSDFKELGVDVLVISTDKLDDHYNWIAEMEKLILMDSDPVTMDFPLIDDHRMRISYTYGMIHPSTSTNKDVRGVFIIDPDNIVRSLQFYPIELGRNMLEIKRSIMALQTADKYDVVIPANWEPGNDVLLYHYDKEVLAQPEVYQLCWFLTYKKL